jgi:transketolase
MSMLVLYKSFHVSIPSVHALPLRQQCDRIRRETLRLAHRAGVGHLGSALSIVEILTVLYGGFLRVDSAHADDPERDRFILSKGHGCLSLYAVLHERGFIGREAMETFLQDGTAMAAHPSPLHTAGVECATGSLGHGLGVGCGLALAAALDGSAARTVVLLSDGECEEGSTWEAALFAAHWKLERLLCIVDSNKLQGFGRVEEVLGLEPLPEKWRAFGWDAVRVDGHDPDALAAALDRMAVPNGRPRMLIADTVKGKGIPDMEDTVQSHYLPLTEAQMAVLDPLA